MKLTLSTIADIMPIGEFLEDVENGGFIDYDGFGYLGTATHESNIDFYPSDLADILEKLTPEHRAKLTHVHWYNR